MNGMIATWTARLRHHLLSEVKDDILRLELRLDSEIEHQRAALANPEILRPLIGAALEQEAERSPEQIAEVLGPLVEMLVRRRERETAIRRRRVAGRVLTATVIASSGALLAWHQSTLRHPAPARAEQSTVSSPLVSAARPVKAVVAAPVILEERDAAFGLAQTQQSDAELTRLVRARLSRCAALSGARVSFAVKDGWVWLRGEATAAARDAAGQALADLGDGVVVVNQIEAETRDVVAEAR